MRSLDPNENFSQTEFKIHIRYFEENFSLPNKNIRKRNSKNARDTCLESSLRGFHVYGIILAHDNRVPEHPMVNILHPIHKTLHKAIFVALCFLRRIHNSTVSFDPDRPRAPQTRLDQANP
jgi:hypothetical protein